MKTSQDLQTIFEERVAVRHRLYSALLGTLPFGNMAPINNQLELFAAEAKSRLQEGVSPVDIVEDYLNKWPEADRKSVLFRFLQIVERQVVLFDAVEDAAYDEINNLIGPGTVEHLLERVGEEDVEEDYTKLLDKYRVRIVLTAHPTQFYPDSVLGIIRDLTDAIEMDDLDEIRTLLLQLGHTKFRNKEKPTPLMEAKSIIWYLENNFYSVLPDIQERATHMLPAKVRMALPSLLEIGFWPCGDRDGNPFVTADITRQVGVELKSAILNCYINDAKDLLKRVTFDGAYEDALNILERLKNTLTETLTGSSEELAYNSPDELKADLVALHERICKNHDSLFIDRVEDLHRKVQLFGFHFAIVDLRQDSRIHENAILSLLPRIKEAGLISPEQADNYSTASEEERIETLIDLMEHPAPIGFIEWAAISDSLTKETLLSYEAIKQIQRSNGVQAAHRSIISNTQSPIDLFEVLALAHLAGSDAKNLELDIVPLFETIDDLENSLGIMTQLYSNPFYKTHLKRRGMVQHIMLGFSDGTKDGGYLGANNGIYRAKRNLTKLSRDMGINVTFFDGRGGPSARGGGNTHRFYRSMGADVEHDQIHLTIQGQTISSNFGTKVSARFNMEQMFTAGLESFLFHSEEGVLSDDDANFITELAETARRKYLNIKEDELFVPYLEEMTPLRYYDRLNIGSRPTKRKNTEKLKLEDLRAIPFVGSWSQIKQNIPGFYGLGTALDSIRSCPESWQRAQRLYKESLFFQTLMNNAMQALAKTFLELTAYLHNDPNFGRIWNLINDEVNLSRQMLKELAGISVLLEREPISRFSIEERERIVLPLLVVQQYALDRVRAAENEEIKISDEDLEMLRKLVVKSLAANINASRNSA